MCVQERETLSPVPGDHALHCEAWASASLVARASETADRVLVSGACATPFDLHVLDAVSMMGRDWRIAERDASLNDEGDLIALELIQSAPTLALGLPPRAGVPLLLSATSIDSGRGTFAHVTWTPPPAADCLVRWYEVQYDSGSGWTGLVTTRATEAIHLARGAEAVSYRVRAISPAGDAGAWAEARDEAVVEASDRVSIVIRRQTPLPPREGDQVTIEFHVQRPDGTVLRHGQRSPVEVSLGGVAGTLIPFFYDEDDEQRNYSYVYFWEDVAAGELDLVIDIDWTQRPVLLEQTVRVLPATLRVYERRWRRRGQRRRVQLPGHRRRRPATRRTTPS